MRSTGEVMGQDEDFGIAFAKTQMAAKPSLPLEGTVFMSVKDSDKPKALEIAKGLHEFGFSFYSTEGTAKFLNENGIEAKTTLRISEGRPNVADLIKNGKIQLVINTPLGLIPRRDENGIRSEAVLHSVPVITTLGSAFAALQGIRSIREKKFSVKSLQDLPPRLSSSVIALLYGPDQPGLVAKTAGWIHQRGGNVLHADQHLDRDENIFFQRVEWQPSSRPGIGRRNELLPHLVVDELGMKLRLARSDQHPRVALMVTKEDHCFHDLALRQRAANLMRNLSGSFPIMIL